MHLVDVIHSLNRQSHSRFQIDRFILARVGGTMYGCYQQAIREACKRLGTLADFRRELPSVTAKELTRIGFEQDARKADVIEEFSHGHELTHQYYATCEELIRFLVQIVHLRRKIGFMSGPRQDVLDCDQWTHRTKCTLATDLICTGGITPSTLDLLVSLPLRVRSELIPVLYDPDSRDRLLKWFWQYDLRLDEVEALMVPLHGKPFELQISALLIVWIQMEAAFSAKFRAVLASQQGATRNNFRQDPSYAPTRLNTVAEGFALSRTVSSTPSLGVVIPSEKSSGVFRETYA
jgi:hypothetical protein